MHTSAFTLVELLVVVSIIAILVSILLPSISLVRTSAKRTACSNTHRQLYIALRLYVEDHEDPFVPVRGLSGTGIGLLWQSLFDYADTVAQGTGRDASPWTCPEFKRGRNFVELSNPLILSSDQVCGIGVIDRLYDELKSSAVSKRAPRRFEWVFPRIGLTSRRAGDGVFV